jgi:hypothetical protein
MQLFQPTKSAWGLLPYSEEVVERDPSESPDTPMLERRIDVRYLVAESQMKIRAARDGYRYFFEEYGAKVRTIPGSPQSGCRTSGRGIVPPVLEERDRCIP